MNLEAGVRPAFPPSLVVQVKALACELPHRKGLPLSRFSIADIRQEVLAQGLVAQISGATIWRWLSQDAIRPWRYRSWIFPRDPLFLEKAAPILDLYQGVWQGQPLGPQDFVLSADEKSSIQARPRKHHSLPPAPALPARIEHEYERKGAWVYLAAWDAVVTMLEKLEFRQLVEETLTLKRVTRAMPWCEFVLSMVLALYVGFLDSIICDFWFVSRCWWGLRFYNYSSSLTMTR
jgi:hypothetical protein